MASPPRPGQGSLAGMTTPAQLKPDYRCTQQIHAHQGKHPLLPISTFVSFTREVIMISGDVCTAFAGTVLSVLTLLASVTTLGGNTFLIYT